MHPASSDQIGDEGKMLGSLPPFWRKAGHLRKGLPVPPKIPRALDEIHDHHGTTINQGTKYRVFGDFFLAKKMGDISLP